MELIVEFDLNADLLSVPESVVENIEVIRQRFLRWVYSPEGQKKLTKRMVGSDGQSFACVCYNSEEFIDWLNKKVLQAGEDRATLVEKNIDSSSRGSVPSIFF